MNEQSDETRAFISPCFGLATLRHQVA